MKDTELTKLLPHYKGRKWLQCQLPKEGRSWLNVSAHAVRHGKRNHGEAALQIKRLLKKYDWQWPSKPIIFITDVHADADAFFGSLVASGGAHKTGAGDEDLELSEFGKRALFVIGGDCFDKGPSNLRLVRALSILKKLGADIKILAGNHDLRVLFGMRCVGLQGDYGNEHFFIRMGKKAIPFLKELSDEYLNKKNSLKNIPDEEACKSLLYPSKNWYEKFPEVASWVMPQNAIDKEIRKIRQKSESFERAIQKASLNFRQVYAAALKWQELFLIEDGEFSWFYDEMTIAFKKGAFFFVHAGLDDRVVSIIRDQGIPYMNKQFSKQIKGLPFEFYYGAIASVVRTKYRAVDMPLTSKGANEAHEQGIHAIVHGHRNLHFGQRVAVRKGLLNFECDTTMDINSRLKEDVPGHGAGVTVILPEKIILGISTDYKHVKVFDYKSIKSKGLENA